MKLGIQLIYILSLVSSDGIELKPSGSLFLNRDNTFNLINFSDLHYGEEPSLSWGPEQDRNSSLAMRRILNNTQAKLNLVVFGGDQLTAESMYTNGTEYLDILFQPLIEKNLKWASVYGNHDMGPNVPRLDIYKTESQHKLSLTKRGPKHLKGITNYYLPVYKRNQSGRNRVKLLLWFLDSRGGRTNSTQEPSTIDKQVVEWFTITNQKLMQKFGEVPALMFFHIPAKQYVTAQKNLATDPRCSGLNDDDVSEQDRDTGIMKAIRRSRNVQAVFVGHDHGNAWCCYYKNLPLCYNKHTGYGGYGTWDRGARAINLNFNSGFTWSTYIQMENGTVVDPFTAN